MPKITDFGVAKLLEDETDQTREGEVIGTPQYMAPEQAGSEHDRIGPGADVYSLGVILYELLVGRVPLRGADTLDTLLMVRTADPVPPVRLQPNVPRDLEAICLKCLEKETSRRYTSASALADDLRRFLDGRPVQARPVTNLSRYWRWCRRKPLKAALAATVVFSLMSMATVWAVADVHVRKLNSDLMHANGQLEHKNSELAESRNREHRQRLRAESNFGKAREAVHDLLSQMGRGLALAPHLTYLQHVFLKRALRFHQGFLSEQDDDPAVRFDFGPSPTRQLARFLDS